MSENMSEERLAVIMTALPDELSLGEIYALFQTIFDAYRVEARDRLDIASQLGLSVIAENIQAAQSTKH